MILEIIGEWIVLYLMGYPGGFLRWLVFRKKKLMDYCNDHIYLNIFPLFLITVSIILIYHLLK
jgi:hypothetical protein